MTLAQSTLQCIPARLRRELLPFLKDVSTTLELTYKSLAQNLEYWRIHIQSDEHLF